MNDIFEVIKKSKSILLLSHENPDGDAIGSLMSLFHVLKSMKKDVDCVIPEIPETFLFLNGINETLKESNREYDLAIVVDTANVGRIGQLNNELDRCKFVIVIDHHTSNTGYGDINYVEEEISSTCQVLYFGLKELNIDITKNVGEALATGMLTDTAGFRNDNVDQKTYFMAAELMELGIDIHKIYYLVLSKKTMAQYLLMKLTLDHLEILHDGKIAFSYVSEEDMCNVGAKLGDHEGLVDIGRNIGGVEASIFMRESDGIYRISLRSNGIVNVNKVAKRFDGGGHKMAAGIKISGNFKEIKEKVISMIAEQLK